MPTPSALPKIVSILPKIVSCFGVIIENNQIPPRIYLVHNTADPLGPNGEEGKPDGWGLPGGGGLDGEKPYEDEFDIANGKYGGTVRREVLGEAGLLTEIATRGKDSEFGEILFESKPYINNDIYIFHLQKIGNSGFANIEETNETRRVMMADLGSILMMPLAIKTMIKEDGTVEKTKNSEGIYFSTRERIFGVLSFLGYDFYKLIPDLNKIFPETKREEIGNYVYGLLAGIIRRKNEIYENQAKRLRPEDDELLERYGEWFLKDELLERYQPWAKQEKK